eukprot:Lithocolla_globosa_v1_NODE_700_length_3415_cov_13.545833.p1 type:complete len:1022 gc:universal NODE_700_length_3415_cov_13.545833:3275-210(-)
MLCVCCVSAGWFGDEWSCTACTAGTFQDLSNQSECKDCGYGFYQSLNASISCNSCDSNGNTTASTSVAPDDCFCNAGYSGNGVTCDQCLIGTFKSTNDDANCTSCPSNTTMASPGKILPSDCLCDFGYAGPTGHTSCTACPNGNFAGSLGQLTCDECGNGFYQPNAGQDSCYGCVENSNTTGTTSTKATDCFCLTGYGGNVTAVSVEEKTDRVIFAHIPPSTVACNDGDSPQSECNNLLNDNTAFWNSDGQGRVTWNVKYDMGALVTVSRFQYKITYGGSQSPKASRLQTSVDGSDPWVDFHSFVQDDMYSTIDDRVVNMDFTPITTQYVRWEIDSNHNNGCCPTVSYSTFYSIDNCAPCAKGFWQNQTDQLTCVACAENASTPTIASTDKSQCECNLGHKGDGFSFCDPCGYAAYQDTTGSDFCHNCSAHQNTTSITSEAIEDCLCLPGYQGNHLGCTECGFGKFQAEFNHLPCASCDPNGNTTSTTSTDCFCNAGWEGDGMTCTPCAVGYFKPTNDYANCTACPVNTTTDSTGKALASDCLCDLGFAGATGHTSCSACPSGSFAPSLGEINCSECGYGFYQPSIGLDSCNECDVNANTTSKTSAAGSDCFCNAGWEGPGYRDGSFPTYSIFRLVCVYSTSWCDIDEWRILGLSDIYHPTFYMTADSQNGVEVTASSTHGSRDVWRAFDGEPTGGGSEQDIWHSNKSPSHGEWIQINFGYEIVFVGALLDVFYGERPKDWTILGKNGEDWDTLYEYVEEGGSSPNPNIVTGSLETDSITCTACPVGSYKATYDDANCTMCPDNTTTSGTGKTLAEECLCGLGYFGPSGHTSCTACSGGYYSGVIGQVGCDECGYGFYQPVSNQDSCLQCPPYSNNTLTTSVDLNDCLCQLGYAGNSSVDSNDGDIPYATAVLTHPAWNADEIFGTSPSSGCCQCNYIIRAVIRGETLTKSLSSFSLTIGAHSGASPDLSHFAIGRRDGNSPDIVNGTLTPICFDGQTGECDQTFFVPIGVDMTSQVHKEM